LNAGYRVSSSHCKSNSVKTDAPDSYVWDILRCWVKKYPVSQKRLQEHSVTTAILNQSPAHEANFAFCKNAVPQSSADGLLRYQPNPMPNWGPGTRSKSK
jgi:tRNA (guanine26-N2/guanine27-N2)-dimethyltransferase